MPVHLWRIFMAHTLANRLGLFSTKQATNATTIAMRFNKSELNSLASNPATRFDKEGLLIVIDRQEGFLWRSEGKLTSNVQTHKPLSHPLKHTHPNPRLVTKGDFENKQADFDLQMRSLCEPTDTQLLC